MVCFRSLENVPYISFIVTFLLLFTLDHVLFPLPPSLSEHMLRPPSGMEYDFLPAVNSHILLFQDLNDLPLGAF